MLMAVILFLIPFLPVIESLRSGAELNYSLSDTTVAVLGAPFGVICLIMIYRHYSWRYTVDAVNIESRRGIIARNVSSIRIADVRNINVKQSLFERILFIGDVEFSSAGTAGVEVVFKGISRPMRIKQKVQEIL
jgi:uncharacterized membrane protein YdbT with pleckstrin-like domain